jgi:hypothetical protein
MWGFSSGVQLSDAAAKQNFRKPASATFCFKMSYKLYTMDKVKKKGDYFTEP